MAESPDMLCGYRIIEPLREDSSFLAAGPAGRRVVLKRLEADCMLRGGLHPSVRERLERVRELAHAGVANLHGVGLGAPAGKGDAQPWLIWEYLPGVPFDSYATESGRSASALRGLARELTLTVDSLHQQGIVHGALVTGNVLVTESGAVRLTHVSPLLFDDASVDCASVLALLEHVLDRRDERENALGVLLSEARASGMTLSMLASRLAAAPAAAMNLKLSEEQSAPSRQSRRRSLAAAVVVSALAIGGGALLWHRLDPRPATISPIVPGSEISIRH